jgi:tetratricopeptide (TPR) repeat protein
VWSDTWDRDFNDVFAIQDEIGEAVVQALEIHLLDELPRLAETSTAAYELYLEAQGLMNQGNAAGFHAAESLLKRALEIDPEYSPAWSRLAWAYFIGSAFGAWEPTEAVQVARDAAETALRLDNANANAHVILANITSRFDRDIAGATRRLNTALELSPTNTFALGSMAVLHRSHGRLEEAIQYHETARALDPLALPSAGAANAYFYSGRREQGIAYYREMIEARPLGDRTHTSLALALASIGDIDGALTELDKAIDNGHRISVYVYVYEQMGDAEKSDQALEELLARGNRWTMEIAEAYACRGELDEAFVWLDRAMDRYDGSLIRLMYTPFMEELRADPRFDAVVERMGYVEPTSRNLNSSRSAARRLMRCMKRSLKACSPASTTSPLTTRRSSTRPA